MRTPLQEQLLKAGLVKKHKVAEAAREQAKARQGKTPIAADAVDVDRLRAERIERDRQLAAEQKAQSRMHELRAQIRQIIDTHKLPRSGEIEYRFVDEGVIRSILVNEALRSQLAKGVVVIVRQDSGYELLPRVAAQMIYEREGPVVVDHGRDEAASVDSDDDYYRRFPVPDDLIW